MTVDFIFESLNQFFPAFAGNSFFLIMSMLIPIGALLGFITVYGFGVIYSEIKVSSFMKIRLVQWARVQDCMQVNGGFYSLLQTD